MSTLQKWIDRAMTLNTVDSDSYPAAIAIEDANIVIHQIEDYITSAIGEGFFWDILTDDTTVVGQSEYTMPVIASGSFNGMPKVESVSICYVSGQDFIPATKKDRQQLLKEHDLSWYEKNQPQTDPIYMIADNSYFIYPAPTEAIAGGLKAYGIKSLADVTAATAESDIFGGKIPFKYYYLISDGMKSYIKQFEGKEDEATAARREFRQEKLPELVKSLGNRETGISFRGFEKPKFK